MSYGSDNGGWATVIISIVLIILIVVGFNSCTASTWNDGICPACETRYELRGVSRGVKYYSCPDCGQEVSRWG